MEIKLMNYRNYTLAELVKELQHKLDMHVGEVVILPKAFVKPLIARAKEAQGKTKD